MSTLPSYINLSRYSKPILNQTGTGSCVPSSIVQAMALQANELGKNVGPLAAMALYYDTRDQMGTISTDSGSNIDIALAIARDHGVVTQAIANQEGQPYGPTSLYKNPTPLMDLRAADNTIKGWTPCDPLGLNDTKLKNYIGTQLMEGKPVLTAAAIPGWMNSVITPDYSIKTFAGNTFSDLVSLYNLSQSPNVASMNNQAMYGHEFLIVGMDDALFNGQGGYIVENSWGTGYGVGGYQVIPYDFRSHGFIGVSFTTLDGINGVDQAWTPEKKSAAMVYSSVLDRAADVGGLNYWAGEMKKGITLKDTVVSFMNSAEGKGIYDGMNNTQFINEVYMNTRGRAATAAEIENKTLFLTTLNHSRADVMYDVMTGVINYTGDIRPGETDFFNNRTMVAEAYALTFQGDASGAHYTYAKAVLQNVTSDANTAMAAIVGMHDSLGYTLY